MSVGEKVIKLADEPCIQFGAGALLRLDGSVRFGQGKGRIAEYVAYPVVGHGAKGTHFVAHCGVVGGAFGIGQEVVADGYMLEEAAVCDLNLLVVGREVCGAHVTQTVVFPYPECFVGGEFLHFKYKAGIYRSSCVGHCEV